MVQKKKMGTTRQARKQYAITSEGVEFVENKLQGSGGGDE
jgi:DNA-binding PadR family transcriptional regulator